MERSEEDDTMSLRDIRPMACFYLMYSKTVLAQKICAPLNYSKTGFTFSTHRMTDVLLLLDSIVQALHLPARHGRVHVSLPWLYEVRT
jgi:hypothetical protein